MSIQPDQSVMSAQLAVLSDLPESFNPYGHSLHQYTTVTLCLTEPAAADNNSEQPGDRRPIPFLPFGTTALYKLTLPLKDNGGRSIVWRATPVDRNGSATHLDDGKPVEVVLKFLIPSRLESFAGYSAQDAIEYQANSFTTLADCQGRTLPYFFGTFKANMPELPLKGELGTILAMEYIPAKATPRTTPNTEPTLRVKRSGLWQLQQNLDRKDSNSPFLDFKCYLALFRSALDTLYKAHSRGIVLTDVHPDNLLVDEANCQIVLIDWTMCGFPSEQMYTMEQSDIEHLYKAFTHCDRHVVELMGFWRKQIVHEYVDWKNLHVVVAQYLARIRM